MSVFAASLSKSQSSQPASILKKHTSLRAKLNQSNGNSPSKVRFTLPHAKKVHQILLNFSKNGEKRDYENLVCLIRDSILLDDDLSALLKEATECISLLNQDLRLFVEALFSIDWVDRNESVVSEYQTFIVNLLSAHNYHSKYVIERLVYLFLPGPTDPEWPEGVPSDADCLKCGHVHSLLNVLMSIVPMCKELLLDSLQRNYPYYVKSAHMHEYYLHNLLWLLDYQPNFRPDIFHLIFSKLVILDVNAPREEILKSMDDDEMFLMEDDARTIKTTTTVVNSHAIAHTLDVCLDKIYNYMIAECHNSDTGELLWKQTKAMYQDLLTVFDNIILPTYNLHHVQFVMFLLCCFKPAIVEAFLNYLWKKVCNPNVAPVLRQASVSYIASLIARATFVPLSMLKGTLQQMTDWIHSYISTQDGLECVNSDVRVHTVFYSVCQALFYVIAFRHKELVANKKSIVFLENLNLTKIITCRLNPLRVCQSAVVQNFAAITRKYQLCYCYSVMEHNARNTMPVIYRNDKGAVLMSNEVLDAYFPFDPYILERSASKIQQFYREYQESDDSSSDKVNKENDVDDFLYQTQELSSSLSKSAHKFSYSSSPGFKFKS